MLYTIFKILLKIPLKVYFNKIYFENIDHLSPGKPLILSVNHGNSFMDAMLLAVFLKRKMYFLARADAFNSPFKRWFLKKINLLPVYRIRDGRENLLKNDDVFKHCYEILANCGVILIFSEGNCVVEKRLRPLRSGTAQLAIDATNYFNNELALEVVPVSINYSNPLQYQEKVWITIGKPLKAGFYVAKNKDRNHAIKNLTADLASQLKQNMVIIPDKEDDGFYNMALRTAEINIYETLTAFTQIRLANALTTLKQHDWEAFYDFKIFTMSYQKQLSDAKLDHMVNIHVKPNHVLFFMAVPFYALSYFLNYPAKTFISYLTKTQITDNQFVSAVRVAAGLFTFGFSIIIYSLIIGALFKNYLLGAVLASSICAIEIVLYDFLMYQNNIKRLSFLKNKDNKSYHQLIEKNRQMLDFLVFYSSNG